MQEASFWKMGMLSKVVKAVEANQRAIFWMNDSEPG